MSAESPLLIELTPCTGASSFALESGAPCASFALQKDGQFAYVHTPENASKSPIKLPLLVVLYGAGKGEAWDVKEQVALWSDVAETF